MTILLFGATGSAGSSVLDACLASDDVREVRVMTRRLFGPIRSLYVTGDDIGRAMLQARRDDVRARVIENTEIRAMADRAKKGVGRGSN